MKKIWLSKVTPEQFIDIKVGDWIEGVGDILSENQAKFIREYGNLLCKLTKALKSKREVKIMSKFDEDGFRVCEFCGCTTNAHMRACCNAGREADEKGGKSRMIDELKKDLKDIMSKYALEELNIDIIFGKKHLVGTLSGKSVSIEDVGKIEDHPKVKEFSEMVTSLMQTEFCKDYDPGLLHGFIGCASEAGELLNRYKKFIFYHGESFTRTDMLIELSDLLHYIQMILGKVDSSLEEIMCINIAKLKARYPNGYTHDKAITHHRNKKTERAAVEQVVNTFTRMKEEKTK